MSAKAQGSTKVVIDEEVYELSMEFQKIATRLYLALESFSESATYMSVSEEGTAKKKAKSVKPKKETQVMYEGKASQEVADATNAFSSHIANLVELYGMCAAYITNAWEEMAQLDTELAGRMQLNYILERKEEYKEELEAELGVSIDDLPDSVPLEGDIE